MISRILTAIVALGAMLSITAHAQTLILEPDSTVLGAGDTFSLKVAVDTSDLPIAGFSVYFNMAGTDATGSFVVQSEILSPDWNFMVTAPTLPAAIPDVGLSQDYGSVVTPGWVNLPASSDLWLFTLQIKVASAVAPGNYTIQATTESIFFYDVLSEEGKEFHLPSSSIAITVIPEPSTLPLALASVGIVVLFRRKLGSRVENGRKC